MTITASAAAALNVSGITTPVAVADTSAAVITYLANLQNIAAANKLASISLTGTGTPALTLTAAQLTVDAAALLTVSGTYTITASGQATAAQASAINSTLAAKISNAVAVSDTAANVVANLAGLQIRAAAGKLGVVTLTDTGTPALTLTAAQLSANATALLKIGGNYTITLSGPTTTALAVSVSNTLVAKVTNGFVVSDTAANVNSNLGGLESLAAAGKLTSITLTDTGTPTLHMTAAQVIFVIPMLAKIVGNYALNVTTSATAAQAVAFPGTLLSKLTPALTVTDTAANIVLKLDALQSLYAAGTLSSISLSGATTLSVTAATLVADSGVLAAIQGGYTLTVASGTLTVAQAIGLNSGVASHLGGLALLDSAANVTAALDTLQSLAGMIGSIALNNSSTPTLTITPQQLSSDANILSKVGGSFTLAVSGTVTVAQATSVSSMLLADMTAGLAVSDTVANVTTSLASLQTLGGAIASIALTDSGTPALSLTAAQLVADATILRKITSPYTLTLSGTLSVAQAGMAQTQGLLTRVTGGAVINDTAASVQGALGTLLGLGNGVASITLSDTGTPAIGVTAAVLIANTPALAKISSAYNLTVTSGTVTATQAIALNSGVTAHLTTGLVVADSVATVTADLDALRAIIGTIASITLTDSGTPAVSVAATQLIADSGVLALISGAWNLTVTSGTLTLAQRAAINPTILARLTTGLSLSDSAAHVTAALDILQTAGATIGSIVLTDTGTPVLSMTATQFIADAATLRKISSPFGITLSGPVTAAQAIAANGTLTGNLTAGLAVSDTAANVTGSLNGLQSLANAGKLVSITLTDSATPTISVTTPTLLADAGALALIGGTWHLTASSGPVTAAQALALSSSVTSHLSSGLAISDSAANITGALVGLQTLGASVASIALTDTGTPALSLTAAQLVADATTLLKISGNYVLTVTGSATASQATALSSTVVAHLTTGLAVSDSTASVTTNLDGLQSLVTVGKLASVTLTDSGTPTLTITPQQLATDAGALALIGGSWHLTASSGPVTAAQALALSSSVTSHLSSGLAISDSVANIAGALAGLQTLGASVASIALTDTGTPALSLTATQLVANATTLLKISGNYVLTVTGAATASQATLASSTLVGKLSSGFAVADSAASVTTNLDGLQSLVTAGKLASVTLTDSGTPTLTITPQQLATDAGALALIGGSWHLTASSGPVTAAQALALSSSVTSHLSSGLAISDSAANITGALAGLQTLGASVASIALTDTGTPALSLTATQLVANATTLLKISGNYVLTVTGSATASQATALSSTVVAHLTTGLAVSDSTASVTTNLDGLQSLVTAGKLTSVTLTDSGTPTLTITPQQLATDAGALALIGGSWHLTASPGSVTAAQAIALGSAVTSHLTAGLTIADTAASITTNLASLQTLGSTVTAITLTDTGGVPVLTLTPAQMIADAATLLKISSPCNISLSGTATAAQAAGAAPALAGKILAGFVVSDTAANVTANLDGLQLRNAATELASITLTDSSTPTLSLNATTLINDAATLALISGSWHLSVTSGTVTVAQATALSSAVVAHLTTGLAVSDSTASVTTNLDGLQSLVTVGKLTSVTLTDSGTPTLTITPQQLATDAGALALIGGSWHLTASPGSVTAAQAIALGSAVTSHLTAGLTIADTAASITTNLASLQTLGSTVTAITLTDTGGVPVLTLTPAQMIADAATLLKISSPCNISLSGTATAAQAAGAAPALAGKILAGFVVSDTAANVTANLDGLQLRNAATELASITLTDSSTPTLSLNATTLINDAATLALISGSWHLSVTSGSVTVAQATALSSAVVAHLTTGLAVSDSAANVTTNLDGLQALGSTIASVVLTGSPATFAVTADQLWHDAGILAKIITGGAVLVADSSNTASAAAAANLGSAPAYTGTLRFADSATNIAGALDSLQSLAAASHLGAVTLTNTGTPTLAITATQLINDATALAMIGGSYALSLTTGTLTAAQALAISNTVLAHLTAAVPVRDTSANIVANLDALQARVGTIASVAFSNGTPTLSLTPTQLTSDIGVLSLASGYNLSVSGTLTAAQAATLSPTSVVAHLTTGPVISDSAANISSNLASLMVLANASKLGSITLTDGGTPTLSVTPAQLSGDVAVLRKITSSYALTPTTSLTADQAVGISSLLVNKLPSNLAVSDTAAAVAADLDGLEVLVGGAHLGSVTLTDTGTPVLTITASQLTSDAAVLNTITGSYQVMISGGITVAQAATYASNTAQLTSPVHVYDTASAVQSGIASLQTLAAAGKLSSIAFTDSGTPNLALTTSVFAASATALGTISGNYTITLTGTLTVAQAEAAVNNGLNAFVPAGLLVSDTAAHVQAELSTLNFLQTAFTSIVLTDAGTPTITINAPSLTALTSFLTLISGTWNLAVTPGTLTVAQTVALPSGLTAHLMATGLNVADTAAAVGGAIDTLQSLGSAVASIALTDSSPVLSLTAGRFLADATTLQKISGTYGITLSGTVTSAQAVSANNALVAKLTSGFAVSDIAANVVTSLSGLQSLAAASKLASIALTDSGTPTLSMTTAVLTADASALALIGGAWNLTITSGTVTAAQAIALGSAVTTHLSPKLALSDSAANIASSLNALQGLGGAVASIALTDSTPILTLTAGMLVNDAATLGKISGSYQIVLSGGLTVAQATQAPTSGLLGFVSGGVLISDTAAAVQSALNTLQGLGNQVASIALTDSTTPTLSMTTTMLVADAATLGKINVPYHVSISSGTVTVAQAMALSGGVTAHLNAGLAISDTAAAVVGAIATLQTLAGTVASIALTDGGTPALALSASQLVADATTLLKISGSYSITLSGTLTVAQAQSAATQGLLARITGGAAISDAATNVQSNLNALQTLGASVASIALTDGGTPALSLTNTQLVADETTLQKITSAYSITLTGTLSVAQAQTAATQGLLAQITSGAAINDTAANVQGALGSLLGFGGGVASITLSDTGTPTITVTPVNLVADAAVLAKIAGAYHLTVSSGTVTVAQAIALGSAITTHLTTGLLVADSAGNVTASLDALQAMAGSIASITLTDGSTPILSITASVLVADAGVMALIGGAWNLTVGSGTVTAAQVVALSPLVTSHLSSGLTISDSSTNVASGIDALQSATTTIQTITLTNSTPVLSLTAAQLTADAVTLLKISSSYTIALSGSATVAQATAANATLVGYLTTSIAVADTAAHVTANLNGLQTLVTAGKLGSVTLTDGGMPTLTVMAATLVADAGALALIGGSWHLTISGTVTAAQAIALASAVTAHLTTGLAVSDTASNVTGAIAGLQTLGATVASIALTDSGTPALALTAAQLVADATTLLKVSGSYSITVSGNATAAQAAAANSTLVGKLTSGLTVSDSAANVVTSLDGLQSLINAGKLTSVTLTDSGTPTLSVSAATLIADTGALALISGAWTLSVTSGALTTAQVVTLNTMSAVVSHLTASVNVSDTAANVVAHVADLTSLGVPLASIALTDTGTPALSLTATQLITSAAIWLKIGGSYSIMVSGTATATQAVAINSTLASKLTTGLAVSATAADVTGNLDALQARSASVASIALTDGGTPALSLTAAQLVADATTLLKISGNYALTVTGSATASQATIANSTLVGKLSSGLAVSDSTASVTTNLDGLQSLATASKLASITLTDGGTPTLTVAPSTLVADAGALALIGGSWHLTASPGSVTAAQAIALGSAVTSHLTAGLTIADTAASITTNLASLQTLGSTVTAITLTDTGGVPVLTLTPAQMIADAATLLKISSPCNISLSGTATAAQAAGAAPALAGKILAGFVVSDTAANVTANLDGLQLRNAATELASITLTDSSTPTLSLNATTLINDAATLALISGSWHLSVTSGSVTVAQATALSSAVVAHLTTGLAVSDSAANVTTNLDGLQALGSTIASVVLTGSPATFAVTADQLWHDAGILAKIITGGAVLVADSSNTASAAAAANLGSAPAYTGTLRFADSATNIAGALDSLQSLAAASHLGAVTLTNTGTPTLAITATQLINDATALAMIGGSYALSLTTGTLTAAQALAISNTVLAHLTAAVPVRDTSANIVANLDALQARVGTIASVAFSNGTPTLSLTPTQLTSDIGVLSLASGYNLSVSGTLTAAQAATLSPTSVVAHLTTGPVISDSAANISSNLASLMVLANASKLGSITLTDGGTPTLSVTPAQLSGDVAVLRKITSSYALTPTTSLTADQATNVNTLLVSKLPSSLTVSDTAANVFNDLDALEVLAANSHLGTVNLTDPGTPVLQVTGDQLTSDAAVLAEIAGSYQVNIMGGITAAQAAVYANNPAKLANALNVVDAASAVASGMASLQTLAAAGKLSSIAFTDSGTPNLALTTSVFAASITALGTIVGNYTISLTGTLTVAQTQAASTAGLLAFVPAHAPVGDTAANVQAALDALKTLGNAVASIVLTDGGTPTITISATTLLADTSVLALISGSWHLAVSPGTLTVAQVTGLSNPLTSHLSPGLALSDTVAHVTGNLTALQTLGAAVATIALTDTSPVLSLTNTQFITDATTLQKISSSFSITLSGTLSVAQTQTAATQGLLSSVTGGVAISDTASAVQAALDALQGYGSEVASITLSDNTTPTITVTSTMLVADASVLALIGGTWNLTVTGTVSAAQAIALSSTVTAHLSPGLAVSDSATQIATNIDALQALGGTVASIALTGGGTPALALTNTQLVADATTLQKVAPSFSITLTGTLSVAQTQAAQTQGLLALVTGGAAISDTAANVQAALGSLLGLGGSVASIALSDSGTPTITVAAADLVADAAVLAKITGGYHLTVSSGTVTAAQATALSSSVTSHLTAGLAVSDDAMTVTSHLDTLQGILSKIASITLTDNPAPTISIADTVLVADAGVLALIGGIWNLTTSGTVTAAQAVALNTSVTGHLTGGLTVSDSSTNVVANLDALQSLGTTVLHIALTDSSTPTLSITAAQLVTDGTTLLKINTAYTITLSNSATAAQATTANSTLVGYLTTGIVVTDNAANVTTYLDGLQTLQSAGELGPVTLSDSSTPTISVTAGTLLADAPALALISSAYHLTVSSGTVTATQAIGLSSTVTTHLTSGLAVRDSALGVSTNIDALQTLGGTVASIALNNGGSPALSITSAQLIADSAALLKVGGSFGITVSDNPTAAQAAAANATLLGHLTTGLTVFDNALNVSNSLNGLQALTPTTQLASITLTDSSTPTISITAAKLVADNSTLALIGGSWHLTIISGTVTAAQAEALSGTVTSKLTAGLALSDNAADIAGAIDALHALGSAVVASIALTDSTPVLALTATQFVNDADILMEISSSYSVTLSGTLTLAEAATASGQGLLAKISGGAALYDSAANVQSGLDTLQGYGGQIASIALNDVSTPTITVTATTLYNDNAALAKISSAYDLTVNSGNPTAAQAAALSTSVTTHLTAGLAVSDSAAGVVASLDALQAKHSSLASIALTGGGTPALAISAAQLVADAATLLLITPPFTITLSGTLTEAQASTADGQGLLTLVTGGAAISDTASDIQSSLGALQALGSKITSIALTDGGTPTITIAPSDLVADAATLLKISSAYHLTLSNGTVLAADATGLSGSITSHLTNGLAVSDSASSVTSSIGGLQTLAAAGHLASIALNNGGTPTVTLTASAVNADTTALLDITGNYHLAVSSGTFTAAQAATLVTDGLSAHFSGTVGITDTASHLVANLTALQSLSTASSLGTVTLNTSPSAFNVTVAQATNDPDAINAILGGTNHNANEVLYIHGSSGGDTLDTTPFAHITNVSLNANSGTMSFVSGTGTVSGSPDTLTLGTAGAQVAYTLNSGVEEITGFTVGRDILNLALGSASFSNFTATDVTVNSTTAISLAVSTDPTHGVILMNPGLNANDLMSDHLFNAGSQVVVS